MTKTMAIALDRSTTPERIAAALRTRIAERELTPGMRLHEVQFTQAFAVSRHTFREAIAILVGEGLLTRTTFKGVAVTALTPADVRDIYRARCAIELPAVDALVDAPPERVRHLLAAIADMASLSDAVDSRTAHLADSVVHQALVAVHGSRRLSATYAALLREQQILLFSAYSPEDIVRTAEVHGAFGRLVQNGDLRAARCQLKVRLSRSEEEMVQVCSGSVSDRAAWMP